MPVREILLLGNENLYKSSKEVTKDDIGDIIRISNDLHDTLMDFRKKYGFGRAIAAPQINEFLRIIYMNIEGNSRILINPELKFYDNDLFELWDDCMSFPGLEVRLLRYRKCKVLYKDPQWSDCTLELEGDLAELIQHEYDHLDGILAEQRAIDNRSLMMER
jgi:peptide deformylase